jgi:DNA polymerase V
MKRIFALVDCNNFYASCERVFNPSIRTRPVIVLSNNDGCVVARSAEAKELGIPFAAPYFKIRHLAEKHKIAVFSSNYTLYADMSHRVMTILASYSPEVEVYSIDEAFLSLSGMRCNLHDFGRGIRETVMKWTGLPVSVGIAPTKTLAKAASHIAKKDPACGGVLDITMNERDEYLKRINVGDIWGIGRKYAEKLNSRGIYSAADFVKADDKWVRSHMTITGLRTLMEMRGHSCMSIDDAPAPKKAIVSSRSFGQSVESFEFLRQSVSSYTARAAEKLRGQNGIAGVVTVFIMTNRFKDDPQYGASLSCELPEASSNTPVITRYALALLKRLYKEGYRYKKAGVMLSDISAARDLQMNLFLGSRERGDPGLMSTVDKVNRSYGSGTLFYASAGTEKLWSMRRELLSPAYTTRWEDIVEIRI